MASWSTPKAEDSECAGAHRGTPDTLHSQANLAAWATPAERDYRTANLKSFEERGGGKKREQLQNQVKMLAAWPTPMAGSPATENYNETGNNDSSRKTVALASWPSPTTPSGGQRWPEGTSATGLRPNGTKATVNLEQVANLSGPVRLTASGEVLTGSDAGMESSGQLNPSMSGWLMGAPHQWDLFAIRAAATLKQRKKK
jgi:hypothetical protein